MFRNILRIMFFGMFCSITCSKLRIKCYERSLSNLRLIWGNSTMYTQIGRNDQWVRFLNQLNCTMWQHRAYTRWRFQINVPYLVLGTCISSALPACTTLGILKKKKNRPFSMNHCTFAYSTSQWHHSCVFKQCVCIWSYGASGSIVWFKCSCVLSFNFGLLWSLLILT